MSTKQTTTVTLSADGATAELEIGESGTAYFSAIGTFGTGTLSLQTKRADGSFANSAFATALTAAGEQIINGAPGVVIRLNLAGATTPSVATQIITG